MPRSIMPLIRAGVEENLNIIADDISEICCPGGPCDREGWHHDPRFDDKGKSVCHHVWIHACGWPKKPFISQCAECERFYVPKFYPDIEQLCSECGGL